MEKKGLLYPTPITFTRGQIVDANGQLAVIIDILQSAGTQNTALYIRFVHNIGNARPYDVLELTPERSKTLRIDQWKPATKEQLAEAIAKRRAWLENELQAVMDLVAS